MQRTKKEIDQLNTLLEVVYELLGKKGRIRHLNAINDFEALIDEIEEISEVKEEDSLIKRCIQLEEENFMLLKDLQKLSEQYHKNYYKL